MSRVWLRSLGEQQAAAANTPVATDPGYTPGCPACNPEGKPGGNDPNCGTCGTGQA